MGAEARLRSILILLGIDNPRVVFFSLLDLYQLLPVMSRGLIPYLRQTDSILIWRVSNFLQFSAFGICVFKIGRCALIKVPSFSPISSCTSKG